MLPSNPSSVFSAYICQKEHIFPSCRSTTGLCALLGAVIAELQRVCDFLTGQRLTEVK